MDLTSARINMLQQQCRTWEMYDNNVLNLLQHLPREEFVPADYQTLAYADIAIPLGHGQAMLTPKEEARLLANLQIQPQERVLEIGTGSGYFTALLAKQAKHVDSVDIFPEFTQAAAKKLAGHHIRNITLHTADAARGYQKNICYDVIVITGAMSRIPKNYLSQLNIGGRLMAIIGQAPVMQAMCLSKTAAELTYKILFDTYVTPLIYMPPSEVFVF